MKVYCTGVARIQHQTTGRIYEIAGDELDWEQVGGDERNMGAELHYEACIEHPELGDLSWGLWEYPIGVQNYKKTETGDHKVLKDFNYGLEHEKE